MSWKQGLDCYTDNIKVKISEKYKPPPRINLPMTYAQRLILNQQTQESNLYYNFGLENNVLDQIKKLKGSKHQMLQERKLRLEKMREKIKEECLQQTKQKTDSTLTNTENLTLSNDKVLHQPKNYYSNILTPIPLSNSKNQITTEVLNKKINISDFENDTYSPFDNMELKSINDMEELAQVLNYEDERNHRIANSTRNQTQMSFPTTNYVGNHYIPASPSPNMNYSQLKNYYPFTTSQGTLHEASCQSFYQNSVDYNTATPSPLVETKKTCKSVPDIVSTIDAELESLCISTSNGKNKSPTRPKSTDTIYCNKEKKGIDSDLLDSLDFQEQELCKLISSMGFPFSRVARVCKILGNDQKKVLEHLLVLSDLIDLGFAEKDASRALIENNNDRDKALDKLVL
ncbi:unnamed protein product [Callosobruchus maculatus]|uniref:UBA domain-containing protein n=1 Tax=Callosobruchus maculatus TaxID=64391 RepID=A0A653CTV5_CALMS|nr:unnamed protein product [Callosobruchus maculatus]